MVRRAWGNYWAGAWLIGTLFGTVTDRPHASWLLGGLVATVGLAVWAYRFHTEPH